MEEKIIKFYEEKYSKERIEKASRLFYPPETERYTIKNVKSKVFVKDEEFAFFRIATTGRYLEVRLDDLTRKIDEFSEVGDTLEVTFLRSFVEESYPAVAILKNVQKNITLINVKLLSIANFIKEDIDKSKISYKNMLSGIRDGEYLVILGQINSYTFSNRTFFNVDDIAIAQELNKFDENIRKLFNRNRNMEIILPQSLLLGVNQLDDNFQIYVFRYNKEKDGFFDDSNFYFDILDICRSFDFCFEGSVCNIETLVEDM